MPAPPLERIEQRRDDVHWQRKNDRRVLLACPGGTAGASLDAGAHMR
jgi:hypothetical protein